MATHSGRWLVVLACLGLMVGRVYAADSADSNTGEAVSSDAAADDTPDASDSSADSTDSSGDAADSEGGAVVAGSPSAPGASTVAADDSAAALSARPDAQDLITMNFQNVDIPVLAKFISEITGKNFILDEAVRGKVSIISPTR